MPPVPPASEAEAPKGSRSASMSSSQASHGPISNEFLPARVVAILAKSPHFLTAAKTIIKYGENLLKHPDEAKYKSINLANTAFQTRVYQVSGGEECMLSMGFVKQGPSLILEQHDAKRISQLVMVLKAAIAVKERRAKEAAEEADKERRAAAEGPERQKMTQTITSTFQRMRVYENPLLQQKALSAIPYASLIDKAKRRRETTEFEHMSEEECTLLELLAWFKKDFFKWVDNIPCEFCGGDMKVVGGAPPLPEERKYQAGTTEIHQCQTCLKTIRFPRYNDPGKLLETRKGRCGEWANCFTLCCFAMGFKTRYVLDFTDHVWAEVFSERQGRWLHCDPCENACDKPLMYEQGWGKKLSYVFAFGTRGVADVIWRYSINKGDTNSRRTKVSEDWLAALIEMINTQVLGSLSEIDRGLELALLASERERLLNGDEVRERELAEQELIGRQSGNEAWRRARGEYGSKRDEERAQESPTAAPPQQPSSSPDRNTAETPETTNNTSTAGNDNVEADNGDTSNNNNNNSDNNNSDNNNSDSDNNPFLALFNNK